MKASEKGAKPLPCDPKTPLGGDEVALDALAYAYDEAVCRDADAAGSGDESLSSALELLARITIHVPHLMVLMTALEDTEDADAHACLAREARRQSAGVLRLGQRALEVHARDVGYAPSTWRPVGNNGTKSAAKPLATPGRRSSRGSGRSSVG